VATKKRTAKKDSEELKGILAKLKENYAFVPEYKEVELGEELTGTLLGSISTEFDLSGNTGTMQTTVCMTDSGSVISGGINLKIKNTQLDMETKHSIYLIDGEENPVDAVKSALAETTFVVKVVRNIMSGIGELAKEDVWVTVFGKFN
jgi:hypothetical protein